MNKFIWEMAQKAKKNPRKIAFPESLNSDILRTASQVVETGIGFVLLIGNQTEIEELSRQEGISTEGFEYFDCGDEQNRILLAEEYREKYHDFTEKSILRKVKDPVRCAMFLLKLGNVDCVAAGKEYSTGDVIFEAMSIVGLKEGVERVSSLGIADIPGFEGPEGTLLALADCAITAQPDAADLAGIAISSADTVRTLLGWEPRVALLSFSTCGSADHESIDVIREAVKRVQKIRPDLSIDGEFQLDSAIIPSVAAKKVKWESKVAGKANILIFPNLHAGNIGVKMIQIFAGANAYGPVLQGFAKPVCDFSRSAPVVEMFGNVAMLVLRAGGENG